MLHEVQIFLHGLVVCIGTAPAEIDIYSASIVVGRSHVGESATVTRYLILAYNVLLELL